MLALLECKLVNENEIAARARLKKIAPASWSFIWKESRVSMTKLKIRTNKINPSAI
jgi:hypothetical protein